MPDLASTIAAAGQSGGTQMRMGTVKAFDATAGTLTVTVAGTDMTGVFYAPSYLPLIGDTVALLNAGPTWLVLCSTTNTLARTTPVGADGPAGTESTSSTSFTDLATPGPAVTVIIGATGRAAVTVSALLTELPGTGPTMGVALSGANTVAADQAKALVGGLNSPSSGSLQASRTILFSGLNQGSTTFTCKYLSTGGSSGFVSRQILVQPF